MPKRKAPRAADEPALPWERLPDESVRAYAQFCAFRDMPYTSEEHESFTRAQIRSGRSLGKVAKRLGSSISLVQKYSMRFNWRSRAEAYDDYVERELREKNESEIRKMNKLHAKAGRKLTEKALCGLASVNAKALSALDIVRMFDIGVKIERLARGQSTERQQIDGRVEQQHSGGVVTVAAPLDLKNLSDEELASLERICSKIQPAEH